MTADVLAGAQRPSGGPASATAAPPGPEAAYARLERACAGLQAPFALVDLDAMWANAADMQRRGARVLLAAPVTTPGSELALLETGTEDLDPIAAIQSFYPMVEALARARGLDPDAPRHLAKVTLTH